jgi:aldehyde:ferredoxin oxidoreductase
MIPSYGYAGRLLRVNLTMREMHDEPLEEALVSKWVGGAGLGAKYLYEEVPPEVGWSDPANRLIWSGGPLSGTRSSGSGTVAVVSKGAMTNMAASSQANGFFSAFLKFCGYDCIIFEGAASDWVYLFIDDDGPALHDARSLLGLDTWEVEDAVIEAHGGSRCSVYSIGPAGENLVRFAAIVGDRGHVAAHNGVGAVMGSKRLKAVAVARGKRPASVFDASAMSEVTRRAVETAKETSASNIVKYGTAGSVERLYRQGALPVKNYTTNLYPEYEQISGQYMRAHFQNKKTPCWACRIGCSQITTVTEGPYAGYVGEEPEYEGMAACGPQIGQSDAGAAVMLANLTDRLGMGVNESGWIMGFAMECYEKGLLTKADTDGLELRWGAVEAAAELLRKIAHREGFGRLFADGVQAAARTMGGEALNIAVYTLKSNVPRTHDHRGAWYELIDTCLSNTGTIEVTGGALRPADIGLQPVSDQFSWQEVSGMNAKMAGRRQWTDTLGVCRFNFATLSDEVETVNTATGWHLTLDDAMKVGRRVINQLRVFNLRCGLTAESESPSPRYGSTPVDGPAAGISIMDHWPELRRNYYRLMGWDEETGIPRPETLLELGLDHLLPDLATIDTSSGREDPPN